MSLVFLLPFLSAEVYGNTLQVMNADKLSKDNRNEYA